jgi:hypothetical protein
MLETLAETRNLDLRSIQTEDKNEDRQWSSG